VLEIRLATPCEASRRSLDEEPADGPRSLRRHPGSIFRGVLAGRVTWAGAGGDGQDRRPIGRKSDNRGAGAAYPVRHLYARGTLALGGDDVPRLRGQSRMK
jgi:hypothetical protein